MHPKIKDYEILSIIRLDYLTIVLVIGFIGTKGLLNTNVIL